jgi:hypothetical protein
MPFYMLVKYYRIVPTGENIRHGLLLSMIALLVLSSLLKCRLQARLVDERVLVIHATVGGPWWLFLVLGGWICRRFVSGKLNSIPLSFFYVNTRFAWYVLHKVNGVQSELYAQVALCAYFILGAKTIGSMWLFWTIGIWVRPRWDCMSCSYVSGSVSILVAVVDSYFFDQTPFVKSLRSFLCFNSTLIVQKIVRTRPRIAGNIVLDL